MKNNNIAKAYNLLITLYENNDAYKPYRDFAELLLNYIILKYPTQNDMDNQIIEKVSTSNIFYYQIIQIRALCFIEVGKITEAKNELLKILNSNEVGLDSKNMAQDLLVLLDSIE